MNTSKLPLRLNRGLQFTLSGEPLPASPSVDELLARSRLNGMNDAERAHVLAQSKAAGCSCDVSQADCAIHGEVATHHVA